VRQRRWSPSCAPRSTETIALTYLDDSSGIVGDDLQQTMDLYARVRRGTTGSEAAGRLAGW
jgi:hypothetical protein